MDRPYTASRADTFREKTKRIPARSTGAVAFALLVLLGAACWLIAVVPPLDSLALALAAAVAWSVWLDRKDHSQDRV